MAFSRGLEIQKSLRRDCRRNRQVENDCNNAPLENFGTGRNTCPNCPRDSLVARKSMNAGTGKSRNPGTNNSQNREVQTTRNSLLGDSRRLENEKSGRRGIRESWDSGNRGIEGSQYTESRGSMIWRGEKTINRRIRESRKRGTQTSRRGKIESRTIHPRMGKPRKPDVGETENPEFL